MAIKRTTVAAELDDLHVLEAEARRRGVPLSAVLRDAVEAAADKLREQARPRFGIARSGVGAAQAAAGDPEAPIPGSPGLLNVALVLDTGPILALLDAGDPDHTRCRQMVDLVDEDLVIPTPVLVEVDYWVQKLLGADAWAIFVEDIARGAYRLHHPDETDLLRAAELEAAYASLDLGLVDASVIVACERLGETKVATLDRRDFTVVRPRHCEVLTLLPA